MIINTAGLSALFTSYNAAFKAGFDGAPSDWDKVATLIPSVSESNLYGFLGNFPKMREWIGDRQLKNLSAFNYTITNKSFESTVEVPRPKIEDDQYGVFTPMMQELGYTAKTHPDETVFGLAALGASSLCYDGQFFLDTDHPIVTSGVAGTASNYDATAVTNLWYLLDCRRPVKPFIFQKRQDYKFQAFNKDTDEHVFKKNSFLYGVDARVNAGFGLWQLAYGSLNTLNSTNVQSYVATMMARKSDEDKPLGIMPNVCLVGPSNWAAARELFLVPTLTGGAANPNYQMCQVVVTPYLT